NGLAKGSDAVNQSISDMTNSALDTATEVSKILYDRLSSSEDFSPKITPVVDLSDTEDRPTGSSPRRLGLLIRSRVLLQFRSVLHMTCVFVIRIKMESLIRILVVLMLLLLSILWLIELL